MPITLRWYDPPSSVSSFWKWANRFQTKYIYTTTKRKKKESHTVIAAIIRLQEQQQEPNFALVESKRCMAKGFVNSTIEYNIETIVRDEDAIIWYVHWNAIAMFITDNGCTEKGFT